ncbi:restriction endonuclease subunit S [Streptomyces sp. NPDC054847]
MAKTNTSTGGRAATAGIIPGKWALSVGKPSIPAPSGFKWSPLSEIARLESGHTPSRRNPEYWDGNVPWIGIKDATGNHGRTITSTLQTITQAGLDNSSARLLPAGTVCLSRTASVGYVVTMGAPMATSQDFINWVCGPELSPRYLHYILVMEQDSVRRFAHGTTHQTVYYPEAKAFHVCIPSREEQDRIVSMLGALDDKIAVNERIEAVADKLMISHLEEALSQRAIDVPLSEVAAFHNKKRVPLSSRERSAIPGPHPYYGAAGIIDHVEGFLFSGPHVLVGEDGTVVTRDGRPVVQFVWGDFWVNNHAHVLTGTRISSELLAIALQFTNVASLVTGAVQPKLNMRNLQRLPLRIPHENDRNRVEGVVARLWETVRHRRDESRTLAALRDTLLPQLMSGRLRVKDAEKIVEDNT